MAFTSGNPTTFVVTPAVLLGAATNPDAVRLEIEVEYAELLVRNGVVTADGHVRRAAALHALGRYEEAIEATDAALELQDDHVEATFLRGVCIQLLALELSGGNFDTPLDADVVLMLNEAMACFDSVLRARPDDAEANQYLVNLRFLVYEPSS